MHSACRQETPVRLQCGILKLDLKLHAFSMTKPQVLGQKYCMRGTAFRGKSVQTSGSYTVVKNLQKSLKILKIRKILTKILGIPMSNLKIILKPQKFQILRQRIKQPRKKIFWHISLVFNPPKSFKVSKNFSKSRKSLKKSQKSSRPSKIQRDHWMPQKESQQSLKIWEISKIPNIVNCFWSDFPFVLLWKIYHVTRTVLLSNDWEDFMGAVDKLG